MYKYLTETLQYWQYKVAAGLVALVFSDDFFKVLLAFVVLELIDIFTRWLAQSKACFRAIYPNMPCGLWRCVTFIWQAHKWRYINSALWRNGFCDKMLLYLLLLLTSAFVDTALALGHAPRVLTTIVVTVLSLTEALSIVENLSETTDSDVIRVIKGRVKKLCNTQLN